MNRPLRTWRGWTLAMIGGAAITVAGLALVPAAPVEPSAPAGARATRAIDLAKLELIDVATGQAATLRGLAGSVATLVFFASNECPVALAYEQQLAAAQGGFEQHGIKLVAVSSSYAASRAAIDRHRSEAKLPYPLYEDVGGRVARALDATRTSEVALIGNDGAILYQGRIDDRVTPLVRRPKATTHELADAIAAVTAGKAVSVARTEAAGCVIARPRATDAAEAAASSAGSTSPAEVTYATVGPLLQRYCVTCHRPGEVGPMSLIGYDQAAGWADTIAEVLRDGRMPPWRQSPPDPRYGEFLSQPVPSQAEIDAITSWASAGAPRGDGVPHEPAIAEAGAGWSIGEPDLVLEMPAAYEVPAIGVVEYQYFKLLDHTDDERWVDAIQIKPSVRSVVHHANVYMAQAEIGTVGFAAGERWASFAPGRPPTTFPAGVARRLPKGAVLTLEVHYTPDGVAREDRTRIGIRFARATPRYEARSIPVGTVNFQIPPHHPNYEVTGTYTLKGDGRIASFTPHMHDRGKDFRFDATLPDGTTRTLLFVPKYNFKWQFVYVPKQMVALPRGTVIKTTAHYDNSAQNPRNPDPDKVVRFGQQTFEEMMFGFVELVYDEDVGSPELRALRDADRKSLPQDRGFASRKALAAWAKGNAARDSD